MSTGGIMVQAGGIQVRNFSCHIFFYYSVHYYMI